MSDDVSGEQNDDLDGANPVEQLLELMLYAPIGLLYEYPEVLPKLVKRGKSQVQLAKVFGQMAMSQRQGQGQSQSQSQSDCGGPLGDVTSAASTIVARIITDIGAQIGLAPPSTPPAKPESTPGGEPRGDREAPPGPDEGTDQRPADEAETEVVAAAEKSLPIAGYDALTARELIPLLDELSPEQRARVRAHEMAHRHRKTVLAKLDRLEG